MPSKVRNTKVSFKNGKNEKAESLLKQSFEPLLSPKDGKARLTFCGVEHSLIEWIENGKQKEAPIMKLVFSVLDITHEAPTTIAVTCNYRLSKNSTLGKVLQLMGYEIETETEVVDEDDEFGVKTKTVDPTEVFDFLREKCGLVYKGNLTVALRKDKQTGQKVERPGLWDIDGTSLEPKYLKGGEQERDMMASDVSDEDFTHPEIGMESEVQ